MRPVLHRLVARPELHEPVLLVGLEGWIDAGYGAAAAVAHLLASHETTVVASFDVDELVDHRSRRPVMHLAEGVNTGLTWPSLELRHTTDAEGRDLLLLVGAEPDVRWRRFSSEVVDLCRSLGVRLVVGFGAYPAPVPHTRRGRLATTAATEELARQIGEVRATLDVPAGAGAAIERACADAGVPAIGLWAQVPHYVSATAYPEASARLIDGLATLGGLSLDATPLWEAAAALRTRLDALVADNDEHQQMVAALESAVDAESSTDVGMAALSGDDLAAEVEKFLRDVDGGGGGA